MHEHNSEPGHIPPPDLPKHRTVLGFKPHHFIGGLVLIAILFLYMLLYVNGAPWARLHGHAAPTSTAPTSTAPTATQ